MALESGLGGAVAMIRHGDPKKALPDLAGEMGADLLVVKKRSKSGIKEFLLGSVALRAAKSAPCDVLVLPQGFGREPEEG